MAKRTTGSTGEMSDTALGIRRAAEMAAVDALVRPFGGRPPRRRWYGTLQLAAGVALAAGLRPPR